MEQYFYQFGEIDFFTEQLLESAVLESEIALVEEELRLKLSEDYKEFVSRFGAGSFDWIPLTVMHPKRIKPVTGDQREIIDEYWFWENNKYGISKSYALSCFSCYESESGDCFLFHPSNPDLTLILPREDEEVEVVSGFSELYYFCREYTELEDKKLDSFVPSFF